MAYTYNDFLKAANSAGGLSKFSQDDLKLAQQFPEFGLSMLNLTKDLGDSATMEQKVLAQTAAENLRSAYQGKGSGGKNYYGDQINNLLAQVGGYSPFQYGRENERQEALDAVTNPEKFNYDLDSDVVWKAYENMYNREGRRASEQTLAQLSAATGGRPSSYAVSAAQQAANYYNTQLTDKIPELFNNAYSRYLAELDAKQGALDALNADRNGAITDWLQGLSLLTNQLGSYQQQSDTLFQRELQKQEQTQQAAQQAKADQLAKAELLASMGDYSALQKYYGLSDQQMNILQQQMQQEQERPLPEENEGLSRDAIKQMQRMLRVEETGVWDDDSRAAAGDVSALEAHAMSQRGQLQMRGDSSLSSRKSTENTTNFVNKWEKNRSLYKTTEEWKRAIENELANTRLTEAEFLFIDNWLSMQK